MRPIHLRKNKIINVSGIYQISNYTNDKVYIGSSINVSHRIFNQHLNLLRKGKHHSILLQRHYDKYGEMDLLYDLLEEVKKHYQESLEDFKKRVLDKEQYWVNFCDSANPLKGFNISKNVFCVMLGRNHSEETKQKVRDANNKRIDQYDLQGNFIRSWDSAKQVKEITGRSDSHIRRSCTDEVVSAHGSFWVYTGTFIDEKMRLYNALFKKNYPPVYQYTLQGNIVSFYQSTVKASKETGIKENSIYNCACGKQKTSKGFIWTFSKEDIFKKVELYQNGRVDGIHVYQWDLNGDFIKKFKSINNAGESTGVYSSGILNCLTGVQKIAGGYFWTEGRQPTLKDVKYAKNKQHLSGFVFQYNLQGTLINKFKNAKEAYTKTKVGHITDCLKGTRRKAGGYIWKKAS